MFALFCPIHHYNGLLHWRFPQQQPWLRSQKREINQYTNVKLLNTTKLYKHQARHCISLRNRSLHPLAMFLPTKHPSIPWVPEAFHARFPVSVKSCLRPSAEDVSACGRRNEAPRRAREKTSGTQGNPSTVFLQILKKTSEWISMDTAGKRALKLVNKRAMTLLRKVVKFYRCLWGEGHELYPL